jgi:hypothetical protein
MISPLTPAKLPVTQISNLMVCAPFRTVIFISSTFIETVGAASDKSFLEI